MHGVSEMPPRTPFDMWLDRGMKLIGIVGFVGAAFMAMNGMLYLPSRVEASEKEILRVKEWEVGTDKRLTIIEQDIKYLVKGMDQILRTRTYAERPND